MNKYDLDKYINKKAYLYLGITIWMLNCDIMIPRITL